MSVYRKILVPIDGSPTSNRGLVEAIELAKNQGATLRLVHVLDELILGPGAEAFVYLGNTVDLLREAGEQVVAKAEAAVRESGLEAESVIREIMGGRAADSIVAEANAWGADLIVLGTHGRRGARRLVMGSDAEEIVRTTPVPVLLVRMTEQVNKAVTAVAAFSNDRTGGENHVQENPGAD
jgi:nucleotide-binding universal stress UspA family protein